MTGYNLSDVAIDPVVPPNDLGTYVVPRGRRDGTFRVFFEVPKRLRPANWPATIPLPQSGRSGNLADRAECERIRRDARDLLVQLNEVRAGKNRPQVRDWRNLFNMWQSSSKFERCKEYTKKMYCSRTQSLLRYLDQHPEYTPTTLLESEAEALLIGCTNSPDTRRIYLSIFNILMRKAIKEKWRGDNPFADIRYAAPPRTISLWHDEDVAAISQLCIDLGMPSVAGIIRTGFEVGQRQTDIRQFQYGVQYKDGVFRFRQSKTDQYVTIPATDELVEIIGRDGEAGKYLFPASSGGAPYSMEQLSTAYCRIRNELPGPRQLRHIRDRLRHRSLVLDGAPHY